MKKAINPLATFMAATLLLSSCTRNDESTQRVTFSVTGPLSISIDATTRAGLADESLTDLYVFDGTEQVAHQLSTDDAFGTVSLDLTYGDHDLSFLATRSTGQSYAAPLLFFDKVRPTFGKIVQLSVTSKTASQAVELSRITSQLLLTIDDAIPANATTLEVTIGTYYSAINVSDYTSTSSSTYTYTGDITTKRGNTGYTLTVNALTPSYGEIYNTDVSIRILDDASATIVSHTLSDVPLKANRITNIKGNYFGTTPSSTVTINTTWADPVTITL